MQMKPREHEKRDDLTYQDIIDYAVGEIQDAIDSGDSGEYAVNGFCEMLGDDLSSLF